MKLLIVTQVVDTKHPILGFFHRWIEEFAVHCERVEVICLEAGKHSLPANVTVHSLGKDEGKGRLVYLWRFYVLIWQLRHEYDNVFVHMNQLYVILGALFWRVLDKKIGLWYTHGTVSLSLRLADKLTDHIFTASADSYNVLSEKVVVTGHGIDTGRFAPQTGLPKNIDLVTVGRITESKNLTTLIESFARIRATHDVSLTIVGVASSDAERQYEQQLRQQITASQLTNTVHFVGRVSQAVLPAHLNCAKLFVTTAQNGSLDKAMLEAMACGLPIISMAPGSVSLPLGTDHVTTTDDFVTAVTRVLESGVYINQQNADYVTAAHSLVALIPRIISLYS